MKRRPGDFGPYRHAKAVVDTCIKRTEQDEPCLLLDQEQTIVERVLALYDKR